jgi:hypothetical protein
MDGERDRGCESGIGGCRGGKREAEWERDLGLPPRGGDRYLRGGEREPRDEATEADLLRRGGWGERESARFRP